MTRFRFLLLLLIIGRFSQAQTEAERTFMTSIEDTLHCSCTSCGGFSADADSTDTSDFRRAHTLYKDNQVHFRGCFLNWKFMCGIQCVYDQEKHLERIKIYRDGNLIGEAVMPK